MAKSGERKSSVLVLSDVDDGPISEILSDFFILHSFSSPPLPAKAQQCI